MNFNISIIYVLPNNTLDLYVFMDKQLWTPMIIL